MAQLTDLPPRPHSAAEGGEPPCALHRVDTGTDSRPDTATDGPPIVRADTAAIDEADRADRGDRDGVLWHLPHGGDLDANLVRLRAGRGIGRHVNDEVDVLLVVRSGSGLVRASGRATPIGEGTVVLVPRGVERAISAGPTGLAYLSIHRRRRPLAIAARN
jgi:mannose-6-phosphate isomerase-like protein (cupin superfamily)